MPTALEKEASEILAAVNVTHDSWRNVKRDTGRISPRS
jgi:hypothetical protein